MKPIDFASLRILLVEDETFIRGLLKRMLRNLGGRDIREAADGTAALALLDEGFLPDVVFCDYQMTPMNGLTFMRTVRESADPERAAIPMIMLTAASDRHTVHAAVDLGVGGYLVKPVSPKQLADRISAVMRQRQAAA